MTRTTHGFVPVEPGLTAPALHTVLVEQSVSPAEPASGVSSTPRLGVLTGGADSPGLNAAIRAVVCQGIGAGYQVYGLLNGWRGLLNGDARRMDEGTVRDILALGGTILGTSRLSMAMDQADAATVREQLTHLGLRGVVVIGDHETLQTAHLLSRHGVHVVGVPETMDNDIAGTEYCIGFDSAVTTVAEALDKLHTTASAHHRVMVVEVMGRNTGWVALAGGLAGGAHRILVPEAPFTLDELAAFVSKRSMGGHGFSIVVVAEGVNVAAAGPRIADNPSPQEGSALLFGGRRQPTPGELIGEALERLTGLETRVTVLGHVQRGGSPSVYDRLMASRFGAAAADAAIAGQWGSMVALRDNKVSLIALAESVSGLRRADAELVRLTETLTGAASGGIYSFKPLVAG